MNERLPYTRPTMPPFHFATSKPPSLQQGEKLKKGKKMEGRLQKLEEELQEMKQLLTEVLKKNDEVIQENKGLRSANEELRREIKELRRENKRFRQEKERRHEKKLEQRAHLFGVHHDYSRTLNHYGHFVDASPESGEIKWNPVLDTYTLGGI